MSDEIINPFGILNPVSGEVTPQEANPTEEDLRLIREKEARLAEEAKKNLKTVKVADGATTTTKRPTKNKRTPQAPVVGKPNGGTGYDSTRLDSFQMDNSSRKRSLFC